MHIDQNQFKQLVSKMDDITLNQLVERARQSGLSESEIQEGLKFIKKIKEE